MTRVVPFFLPRWPTDRLRRKSADASPPADAALVMAGRTGRRLITAFDANAERIGIRIGMAVTKAQALVPGLVISDADPAAETAGLNKLALWALQRFRRWW